MKRIQFVELHEQPWFPAFLRSDITDTLQCGLDLSGVYGSVLPLLQCALKATGALAVIDLCSGSGGPWFDLGRRLKRDGLRVFLTDKYPHPATWGNPERCSEIGIRFFGESVDARQVPVKLDGFRTMFTSFHHFPPVDAQAIIRNAVSAKQGIGIFEVTRRSPSAIILISLWSIASFFFIPFVRPFRWSRLFCTYLIPIIPLVLLFDGVVSCLRTYEASELQSMVGRLNADGYNWQTGELRGSSRSVAVTYLIGYP